MKKTLLIPVFLIATISTCYPQMRLRELFMDAEFDLLYESYEEAVVKYLEVLESDPQNSNYNFRVGQCYLNIPGEKNKAVPYLQLAVMQTTDNYKEGIFKETAAPLEAYLFLGNAYKANNQLETAKDAFAMYISLADPKNVDNIDYAHQQIEACSTAEEFQNTPVDCIARNLGNNINDNFSNYAPAVSGDLSKLVFTTRTNTGKELIYFSKKTRKGEWDLPKDITDDVGSIGDCNSADLNSDGMVLLLVKKDNFDSDIYYSEFKNDRWTKMKKVGGDINTKFWESHATFSTNDSIIYFTSNRKGSIGGLDIYKMEMNEKGNWGDAVNLGEPINTTYNEETPSMADETTIYFSSQGHNNMGGYDIFHSTQMSNGEWTVPMNIGYPINTPDDDLNFVPIDKGVFAYHSVAAPEGFGGLDIYHYEIFSEMHPHMVDIMGNVKLDENVGGNVQDVAISVQDKFTSEVIAIILPDEKGNFVYTVAPSAYKVIFEAEGHKKKEEDVKLYSGYESPDYLIHVQLEEKEQEPWLAEENTKEVPKPTYTTDGANGYSGTARYTIQIRAYRVEVNPAIFKNLEGVKVFAGTDGYYRCVYGEYYEYSVAKENLQIIRQLGYHDAFINSIRRYYRDLKEPPTQAETTYRDDKGGYTVQVIALKNPVDKSYFKELSDVKISQGNDGFYRYTVGEYDSASEARDKLIEIHQKGYTNAFIRKISSVPNY